MRALLLPWPSLSFLLLAAFVACTTAPRAKELRTPEKAPHVVDKATVVESPTVVAQEAPPSPAATPPVVDVDTSPIVDTPAALELGEPIDAPPVVVDAIVTEAKPSAHNEPRLAAHRKQLAKLDGGKVSVSTKSTWRHRVDKSARAGSMSGEFASGTGGGVGYGAALGGLRGAAMGDASGVGGLGLRGAGPGGGGSADVPRVVTGKVATRGRGSGEVAYGAAESAPAPPVVVRKSKIVIGFSDGHVAGALTKPDGAYLKRIDVDVAGAVSKPNLVDARPLRAGSTDDNTQFAAFLRFLDERTSTSVPAGAMKIDVAGRRFIRVVDADNNPYPGAEVLVRDWKTEKVIATATTYGDGRAPFYPSTSPGAPTKWLIEANDGARAVTATWQKGEGDELVLKMPRASVNPVALTGKVPLDVLFLIDTTGSMADEIERIKETLLSMTAKVKAEGKDQRAVSLRYGAVLYRDVGDAYVTATRDFTSDIAAFEKSLRTVEADGGGDTPESLNQGLAEAMVGVQWREGAAKVAFLVADAVPHMDYADDIPYAESLQDAVTLGVRIHAVAASGLADDAAGSLVFRQIAQYARGRFIFIEYGGDIAASAKEHGVEPANIASNNLDDILLREIRREIDGWGA